MTTVDVRIAASKILDGMKFNKEKLARDCVVVCDIVDRLNAALLLEREKNAELMRELAIAQNNQNPSSGLPKEFADIFGAFGAGHQG
jgi:hypothetical protein